MKVSNWVSAFRLRTLPLALSTIGMGSFLALEHGVFQWPIFGWAILTTVFLQVLSNLANDYGDSIHGADSEDRVGPNRAVQSGAISSSQMKFGILIFIFLSLISGIILLSVAVGLGTSLFYWFLGFGLLSIIAAYTYTAGMRPYGYAGLGDIMVLIFFGILGVGGSYFLYSKEFDSAILLPSLAMGLLATGVLNINNMRDRESDVKAGKHTIPVRLGHRLAIYYHWFLLLGAIALSALYIFRHEFTPVKLLWIAGLPLIIINGIKIYKTRKLESLDPFLKQLAIGTFLYMIFFGLAISFG